MKPPRTYLDAAGDLKFRPGRHRLPDAQRGREVPIYMTAKVRAMLTEKARAAGVSKPKAAALAITAWKPKPKNPAK